MGYVDSVTPLHPPSLMSDPGLSQRKPTHPPVFFTEQIDVHIELSLPKDDGGRGTFAPMRSVRAAEERTPALCGFGEEYGRVSSATWWTTDCDQSICGALC
jgi:hypothetical protein